MSKKVILTGDRPTGKLHIGHFIGSLKNRIKLQNQGDYDEMYIMIADSQALTDNAKDINKVRENITEVILDYLACGLDPKKVTFFIQSLIPELTELTFYYMNLVTLSRLQRNPTVKEEIKMRDFETSIPVGFLTYPISQAADITAVDATIVPVGDDQLPMIEQTREIVRTFNSLYGETLVEPKELLPDMEICRRLPGTDGEGKMSKSLGNCIYLCDDDKTIDEKVMSMYTDPNHIKVSDPGKIEGNVVFMYLQAFSEKHHFEKYLPEYEDLSSLSEHYSRGGVGDVKIKRFLASILKELITPIREKRKELSKNIPAIFDMLYANSMKVRERAGQTLERVKTAMGINYYKDKDYIASQSKKYN